MRELFSRIQRGPCTIWCLAAWKFTSGCLLLTYAEINRLDLVDSVADKVNQNQSKTMIDQGGSTDTDLIDETGKERNEKCVKRDSGIGDDPSSIADCLTQLKLSNNDDDAHSNQSNHTENYDGISRKETSTPAAEKQGHEDCQTENRHAIAAAAVDDKENTEWKSDSSKDCPNPTTATTTGRMSPGEFFQTSRLRCSALANKLNTSEAFGGSSEFENASSQVDDIIKRVENVSLNETKELDNDDTQQNGVNKEKSNEENEESDLIGRSPQPVYAQNRHAHHPYQQAQANQQPKFSVPQTSPARGYYPMKSDETILYSPAYYIEQQRQKASSQCYSRKPAHQHPQQSYGEYGYGANVQWSPPSCCHQLQPTNVPQSMYTTQYGQCGQNLERYIDVSPPPASYIRTDPVNLVQNSPLPVLSPADLSQIVPVDETKIGGYEKPGEVGSSRSNSSDSTKLDFEQLPDELSDFILTYSRHYSSGGKSDDGSCSPASHTNGDISDTSMASPGTASSGYETASNDGRSPSNSSIGGDIFSPPSAFYSHSPPGDFKDQQSPREQEPLSNARQRFRDSIQQKDLDAAWAWAMRCSQSRPEALFFRDKDGDSLLHIVIWHKDLAKIFVLTEIMMKQEASGRQTDVKLFDLPNKSNETPLYLAVEKGMSDVAAYLLECGADANVRPADPPLHYAAARGMSEIVQTLCKYSRGGINIKNAAGMTPLLCAVKNHGNLDAENRRTINNSMVIRALLSAGADPTIQDAKSGKSVLHFCVERLDPDLVQLFVDRLDRSAMNRLVNMVDLTGYTPLSFLNEAVFATGTDAMDKEKLRQKIAKILLECSVDQPLTADDFEDLSSLLSDPNALDGVQFALLDNFLSSESY